MCSCTEDKEVIGNVIIGRNRVTCQECLDAQAKWEKERQRQELRAQLLPLEQGIFYSEMDGDFDWAKKKKEQRLAIKAAIAALDTIGG